MELSWSSLCPQEHELKEATSLPLGLTLTPLARSLQHAPISLDLLARCEKCFGYISSAAQFDRRRWRCPICAQYNATPSRYATPVLRRELPELAGTCVELEIEGEPESKQLQPLTILVVDVTGDGEYLEMVKAGLLAALDGIPPSQFVGLVTYSDLSLIHI
eukprot:TRINITY_DN6688_c0_g2_i1.p1 TRINITY_DN6688_c0_g2~~TRINITY_DN6688_c0_g2_i1.p1  ORF type:complete len:161 (+),score=31.74 TRINITY_DN6688_c0_g2_i1:166-648(+)